MEPVMMGDEIFFTAENKVANLGRELYKTNLITSESIVREGSEPFQRCHRAQVFDNKSISRGQREHRSELWATNGSFNGTLLVADIATREAAVLEIHGADGLMY